MNFSAEDKAAIKADWALVKQDSANYGIKLFGALFQQNPSFIQKFSFLQGMGVSDVTGKGSKDVPARLRMHAGHIMREVDTIVNNLDSPSKFSGHLVQMGKDHVNRPVNGQELGALKSAFLTIFADNLENQGFDDYHCEIWEKLLDKMIKYMQDGYKQG